MKARMIVHAALVLVVWAALAGCSKKTPAPAERSEPVTTPPPAGETGTTAHSRDAATGTEVQLAGLLGCGHCVFHKTADCTPAVKTASGEIYVIDGVPEGSNLWEKRLEEGHEITVVGAVLQTDENNMKHVAMTSFEIR